MGSDILTILPFPTKLPFFPISVRNWLNVPPRVGLINNVSEAGGLGALYPIGYYYVGEWNSGWSLLLGQQVHLL